MRLSKAAILAVRGMDTNTKEKLSDALGVSWQTLYRYISENDDNLTKASALQIIRQVTGLADSELLEDIEVKETQDTTSVDANQ